MPDCVDRETFDDESDSFVTGGKMNVSRNMSFFDYISKPDKGSFNNCLDKMGWVDNQMST